ncbi:MAG: SpoIIE family protein phosphatase [Bacteroidetes bacterium]|nr:SpoIIE family protein phosphatase [Bacteroidota bacterium]
MDMSLITINTETNECQWAGANNPLYIVSSSQSAVSSMQSAFGNEMHELPTATASCQLYELKGDKMPIAIYERMEPFTNHDLKLEKGDCLYLFSDGFANQFGGPKGKKFMYKKFKEILVQT